MFFIGIGLRYVFVKGNKELNGLLLSCGCHIVGIVIGNETHLKIYTVKARTRILCALCNSYIFYLVMGCYIVVDPGFLWYWVCRDIYLQKANSCLKLVCDLHRSA